MTINGLHLHLCNLNHYHLIRRYQSALIVPCWKRRIFISTINTKKQNDCRRKEALRTSKYDYHQLGDCTMIATSGDVTVGGWGDGGSLGGGEAEESASRRGEWGNLWYNN